MKNSLSKNAAKSLNLLSKNKFINPIVKSKLMDVVQFLQSKGSIFKALKKDTWYGQRKTTILIPSIKTQKYQEDNAQDRKALTILKVLMSSILMKHQSEIA